ncbi:hypothetical protein GGR26_002585 [Lewinella marina]|uniref:Uncharacterized protein n=1 Tax=Neolewinella marina TaxID=438751 RepID=A0A2G0CB44_9BACT|nr:hypothetical protein [Neolewinella marina]NJB86808.1 hypothetical protein [Neolewinella marina]PHK97182.1 hypothetical protein CGL56_17220 [Neolewinella marina]
MANDKNDTPQTPVDPGEAPPGGEEPTQTLCQKWFNDYLEKPLEIDLEVAEGAATVGCLGYDEGKIGTQLRVCRVEDARKIRGEYRGIKNCISTALAAHAAGVTANVTGYVDKQKVLETKLNKALEGIKAAKSGMAKVHALACKLETARKDSCNSEQCKAIDKGLPKVDGVGGLQRFNNKISAFQATISTLNGNADALFEMGIKYAGIQASTNVTSIKPMTDLLKQDADGLATDVTEQCAALDKKIAEQAEALAGEITGLSTALYLRQKTQLTHDFLSDLKADLTDIRDQDCGALDYAAAKDRLTVICETAVTTFNTTATCGEGEESGGNKFNTQDAPSC